MSIAQLMRDMAAAGAPMEAIIMAVEALEARDNAAKAEREKTAERKRRQRARERGEVVAVTVTGQSHDNHCDTAIPPKNPPQTPHKITPVYNNPPTPQGGDVVDLTGKPIFTGRKPRKREVEFDLPSDIPAEPWDAWVSMRSRMRKPLTEQAKRLAVAKLQEFAGQGHGMAEILNNSTMNGWQGLFAPTAKPGAPPTGSGQWDALTRRRGNA